MNSLTKNMNLMNLLCKDEISIISEYDFDYNSGLDSKLEQLLENIVIKSMKKIRGDLYRLTYSSVLGGDLYYFYIREDWSFDCESFGLTFIKRCLNKNDWLNSKLTWCGDEIIKKIFYMFCGDLKLNDRRINDFNNVKVFMKNIKDNIEDYGLDKDMSLVWRTNSMYMFNFINDYMRTYKDLEDNENREGIKDCMYMVESDYYECYVN